MVTFTEIETLRLIAFSHITLLTAMMFIRLRSWDRVYVTMIGLGAAAFFLLPVLISHNVYRFFLLPVFILQIGLSFWLWVFALGTRYPSFKPRLKHWAVLIFKILVTLAWVNPARYKLMNMTPAELVGVQAALPAIFTIVLVVASIIIAAGELNQELNNNAREMRQLTVIYGGGAFILLILIYIVFRGPRLEVIGHWLTVLFGLIVSISLNILLFRSHHGPLSSVSEDNGSTVEDKIITSEDRELALLIKESFISDELFKTEGYTVSMLASHLQKKEYKVRFAINQVLGYRNFNVFLNTYRVEAAQKILIEEPELQIIRLSMDLGYRSLAGFNKAFKDITGLTPTEYRNSTIKDN